MFCLARTGAVGGVRPAIAVAVTRLCGNRSRVVVVGGGEPAASSSFGRRSSANSGLRGLTTRSPMSAAAAAAVAASQAQGIKKRVQRRKPAAAPEDAGRRQGYWCVAAFATAEEFRLEELQKALSNTNLYEPTCLYKGCDDSEESTPTDVIHAVSKFHVTNEPRHLYFFREGSVVGWNVTDLEVSSLINFLTDYEIGPYSDNIIMDEREIMYYTYTNDKKSSIQKGNLHIIKDDCTASDLDRYTFSNAMAHSVKLGTWEAMLEEYIDSVEFVTQDLQNGLPIRITRKEVMKKTGELFGLRHKINLSSDLLDLPDFYWEREQLEEFYRFTCNYFSISTRLKTMNLKINHCLELVELLSHHLSDKHHIRLEWMIIVLIMVEVGFEIIHYAQLFIK